MATLPKITSDFEIILVNDGSFDDTMEVIGRLSGENKQLKWVSFLRNFGHQAAISAGISFASGDAVVTMDGDLQDTPEVIPDLVEKWKSGSAVVYARRSQRKGEFWGKKLAAYVYYRMLQRITSVKIPEDVGDFRLIDRRVVEQLMKMPEHHDFLRGQIAWLGFPSSFVEFEREKRFAGESKYSLKKLLQLAINGVWGFSKFPIVILWIIALLLSLVSLASLFWSWKSGFSSTFLKLLPLFFILLTGHFTGLALLGEYIFRIYDSGRQRPAYIVKDTNL